MEYESNRESARRHYRMAEELMRSLAEMRRKVVLGTEKRSITDESFLMEEATLHMNMAMAALRAEELAVQHPVPHDKLSPLSDEESEASRVGSMKATQKPLPPAPGNGKQSTAKPAAPGRREGARSGQRSPS